ncbi:MAG: tail fiber protein [Aliiglaciecola sp.]
MSIQNRSRKWLLGLCASAVAVSLYTPKLYAGSDPHVGDVMMFGGNFCPRGWAEANGALLAISQFDALFSLYGTFYGGDGRTTFALPDLRGRAAMNRGSGPGLTPRQIGQKIGSQQFSVNGAQLGGHTHGATTTSTLHASSQAGEDSEPVGKVLADDGGDDIYNNETPDRTLNSAAVSSSTTVGAEGGNSISINSQQPHLGVRFCVALVGVYPSRN